MKQRSNTIKGTECKKNLWKQLTVKPDTSSGIKKKSTTITDFLKTVHVAQKSENGLGQCTNSQVISVMDVRYSQAQSLHSLWKQKKYFISTLFQAIVSIWKEINRNSYQMRQQMNIYIQSLSHNIDKMQKSYKEQSTKKSIKIQQLKQAIDKLQSQNKYLKEVISKKQKQFDPELAETNKELRSYLKNMNQIMMSYHRKNGQLQETIKCIRQDFNKAVQNQTSSFREKYQQLVERVHSLSMEKTSVTDDPIQQFLCRNSQQKNEYSVSLLTRSKPNSPKFSQNRKFMRKSIDSKEALRYIPTAFFKDQAFSSISLKNNSFTPKVISKDTHTNKARLSAGERKNFISQPILRHSIDIHQK